MATACDICCYGVDKGCVRANAFRSASTDVLLDLSTGPTSLLGLTTSEVIKSLGTAEYSAQQIASAVALSIGLYGIILGFLNLGFLLEFISLPILSGFISAVAITIGLNQMDSLLGEDGVGDGAATQIHDIFQQLPNANGYAW